MLAGVIKVTTKGVKHVIILYDDGSVKGYNFNAFKKVWKSYVEGVVYE